MGAAFPRGRWTLFRSGAAEAPRPEHSVVQGELVLDTVKVVRNDLNEADLEVVPARKAPAAPAAPQPQKAASGAAVLWSRITSRLFGASEALR